MKRAWSRASPEAWGGTAYAGARWHAFCRGGVGAYWARKPDLAYFKSWGQWQPYPRWRRGPSATASGGGVGPSPGSEGEQSNTTSIAMEPVEHFVPADDFATADIEELGPLLRPCLAPGDAPGAVAGEAAA